MSAAIDLDVDLRSHIGTRALHAGLTGTTKTWTVDGYCRLVNYSWLRYHADAVLVYGDYMRTVLLHVEFLDFSWHASHMLWSRRGLL